MNIKLIRSIIAMLSLMLMNGCVGYAQQPYPNYSRPIFAHPNIAPYGGGYNYGGGYGGGIAVAPHAYVQPGREYRDYGAYRSHTNEGAHREAGRPGGHEER